jgi:predicted SAM-dependent methyltransferase
MTIRDNRVMRSRYVARLLGNSKIQRNISRLIRNRRVFANVKRPSLYLDVGCGPNAKHSNINLDYHWRPGVDVCWDITKEPLPFADGYVAGIYTEHCLEHISFKACKTVLAEFHRIVQPMGRIRVIVPDLELYVDQYGLFRSNGEQAMPHAKDDPIDGIYSPAMSLNRIFRAHGHQFIYDFHTLQAMLEHVGFAEITKHRYGEGKDPALLFDNPERAVESLYIEAIKPSRFEY